MKKSTEYILNTNFFAEKQRQIYKYHMQGLTQGQIAIKLGVSQPFVCKSLKEAGRKMAMIEHYGELVKNEILTGEN